MHSNESDEIDETSVTVSRESEKMGDDATGFDFMGAADGEEDGGGGTRV